MGLVQTINRAVSTAFAAIGDIVGAGVLTKRVVGAWDSVSGSESFTETTQTCRVVMDDYSVYERASGSAGIDMGPSAGSASGILAGDRKAFIEVASLSGVTVSPSDTLTVSGKSYTVISAVLDLSGSLITAHVRAK